MKKTCISILCFLIFNFANAQINSCKFQLIVESEEMIGKEYKVSAFAIRGTSASQADKIRILLNLLRCDNVFIHQDSLCNRFNQIQAYKKLYLNSIEAYVDSSKCLASSANVILRFEFKK